jgi:Tfp pilus assembly protein PilX
MNMKRSSEEKGFALVAALLANLILLAVGIVAINLSSQDIRVSMKTVADKKAVNAAEAGIHWLTVNFDPANLAAVAVTNQQVDASTDPNTK